MTRRQYVFKAELIVEAGSKLEAKKIAAKYNGYHGKHYVSVYPPTCKKIPNSEKCS